MSKRHLYSHGSLLKFAIEKLIVSYFNLDFTKNVLLMRPFKMIAGQQK